MQVSTMSQFAPKAMVTRCVLRALVAFVCCFGFAAGPASAATYVRFDTNFGIFDVELTEIPEMESTVANFLAYVDAGLYNSTIIHRSTTYNPSDIQIIQGGGFVLQGSTISPVSTFAPIPLQALYSNTRGTIAMARTIDPDSATSGWFFNVADNTVLDGGVSVDGYAVFGSVIDATGLSVIDAMADLEVYNASPVLGTSFTELPLTAPELQVGSLVIINSVTRVPEPSALVMVGLAAVHRDVNNPTARREGRGGHRGSAIIAWRRDHVAPPLHRLGSSACAAGNFIAP